MPRSLTDLLARADELAKRAEAHDPDTAVETTTPEMLLRRAAWKRTQAEHDLATAVLAAREAGVAWSAIGDAIDTSAQAAQRRYSPVIAGAMVQASGTMIIEGEEVHVLSPGPWIAGGFFAAHDEGTGETIRIAATTTVEPSRTD